MTSTPSPIQRRACQLCNHDGLHPFQVNDGAQLQRCLQCGLYQYGIVVETEEYESEYQTSYQAHSARKLRTAEVRLNRIAATLDSGAIRLLDIGCSMGYTLEAAESRGWQAVGVDVSETAVHFGQQRGFDVRIVDNLSLPFADESFDVLTAWHIIEHVEDVSKTLVEWLRVLRPGGLLALETPDASCPKVRMLGTRYHNFWTAEHTYTFAPAHLSVFLNRAGFELIARPMVGRLTDLTPFMAAYAVAYRSQLAIKKLLGLGKAFQLFARRPRTAAANSTRQAA